MASSHPDLGGWLARLPPGQRRGGPRRICIATTDIPGPARNGGIGVACLHLGQALVRAGHHVTILYVEDGFESGDRRHWEQHYASAGLEFVHVPGRSCRDRHYYADRVETSFSTYQWLRSRSFDLVHFHERLGIGFHSLHAKRLGLAFADTTLVVMLHGCVRWGETGNQTPLVEPWFFEIDHLERESARLADVVVSPTRYMLDWVRERGWELPAASFVQPLVCGRFEAPALATAPRAIDELVFFGRLEPRKGIELFCDAIDRLSAKAPHPFRVGFLGKAHWIDGVPSADYIATRARSWSCSVAIHGDWDTQEALQHLRGAGRLAVIPSTWDNMPLTVLECIGAGVPFVASATGGIPEEIHPDDRAPVLFAPSADALAAKLAAALERGARPARLGFDPDTNERVWVEWHAAAAPPQRARSSGPDPRGVRAPTLSVCLVHHGRPEALARAIASLEAQTEPGLEVVLVAAASLEPRAAATLHALEPVFAKRGWRIAREAATGEAAARNRAASLARGEYLFFLDAAHAARPDALSVLRQAAGATHEDVYACGVDLRASERADTAESPERGEYPAAPALLARILPLGAAPVVGLIRDCFAAQSFLVRRAWLLERGGFPEASPADASWQLLAAAALAGERIAVLPESLVSEQLGGEGESPAAPPGRTQPALLALYRSALPPALGDLATWLQALLSRGDARAQPLRPGPPPGEQRREAALLARFAGAGGGQDFRHAWAERLEARFQLAGAAQAGATGLRLDVYDRIAERTLAERVLAAAGPGAEARCVALPFDASPFQQLEFRVHGAPPQTVVEVDVVRPAAAPAGEP